MNLFSNNVLNLRIRMPITNQYNNRNFITKITKYDKILEIGPGSGNLTKFIIESKPKYIRVVEKDLITRCI